MFIATHILVNIPNRTVKFTTFFESGSIKVSERKYYLINLIDLTKMFKQGSILYKIEIIK